MRPIETFLQPASETELQKLGDCALELLQDPGMKMEWSGLRVALSRWGAEVDDTREMVRFPGQLIEEMIAQAVVEEANRRRQCAGDVVAADGPLTFSWHTPFMKTSPVLQVSLGGGCPLLYDYETGTARYASVQDLAAICHLGEALEEVVTCGNMLHCVMDEQGNRTPSAIMPLLGAATIARHSSKPGTSALMAAWQLDYLVAMGEVVRGSREEYMKHPLFVNVNDTVPPLRLSRPEGKIIQALAARGLSIYIVPMPLMGLTGPVSVFACAATGIAEILGAWAAAKAVNPDVPLECSIVSGVLEPRTGNPCFSAPEAIAIDLAAAQFFRHIGLRCGTGVGFIDAAVPGASAVFERTLKSTLSAMCGESNYPVGILAAGNIFSPEQVMLDLDIAASHNHFLGVFDGADLDMALALVRERAACGFYMDTDHTASNFRSRIWVPQVFERLKSKDPHDYLDPVQKAHEQWKEILSITEPYHLPEDKAREIERILEDAREVFYQQPR